MLNHAKQLENSGIETVWFMPTLWHNSYFLKNEGLQFQMVILWKLVSTQ